MRGDAERRYPARAPTRRASIGALFGALRAIQDTEISPDANKVGALQNSGDEAFVVLSADNAPTVSGEPKNQNQGVRPNGPDLH